MLATGVLHRPVATQSRQDDRELLLVRPAPVLLPLAQPLSPFGRAAHAEPAAGRSLRRYAPPGSPGAPSQLPVNPGPGSGAGRTICPGDELSNDFTIVVPLFGHPRYFEGR